MTKNVRKYVLKKGNEIVYVGITNDPSRRENEHRQDKSFDKMLLVGGASTQEGAKQWEADRIETYMKNHKGKTPKYNQTTKG